MLHFNFFLLKSTYNVDPDLFFANFKIHLTLKIKLIFCYCTSKTNICKHLHTGVVYTVFIQDI